MQALMASANDGLGRGIGALIYGAILDYYSYQTLWLIIGIGSAVTFALVQLVNMFDNCLSLRLGLDEQFKKQNEANGKVAAAFAASQARRADDNISIASKVSGNILKLAQVA